MGQKIHPRAFRLGPLYTWGSRWYASDRRYKELLLEDVALRRALFVKLKPAGLAHVEIERSINKLKVTLHVSRPGMVIGRGGTGLEDIKKYVMSLLTQKLISGDAGKRKIDVAVEPVKEPNLNAHLVATNVSDQLIKRLPHRRVGNQMVERVMAAGAGGVRIVLTGRIGGAEIARREKYQSGTVPLSTIREEVDFASVPALTKSGYVGIKVWICRKS